VYLVSWAKTRVKTVLVAELQPRAVVRRWSLHTVICIRTSHMTWKRHLELKAQKHIAYTVVGLPTTKRLAIVVQLDLLCVAVCGLQDVPKTD
jgi:hypothetical protein